MKAAWGPVEERWLDDGAAATADRPSVLTIRPGHDTPIDRGIVLFPDGFGLHEHVVDVGRRLARRGMSVAIPDVYAALGPRTSFDLERLDGALAAIDATRETHVRLACSAALSSLGTQPGRTYAVGFCFGGRVALAASGMFADGFAGRAAYYPSGLMAGSTGWPERPIDQAVRFAGRTLLLFGAADRYVPETEADTVQRILAGAGGHVDAYAYPGAGHAFFWERHPNFHAAAAQDSWVRLTRFLDGEN